MLSKKAIFAVCCIVPIAYYWFKYVKQGPVFVTDKKLHGKTVLITGKCFFHFFHVDDFVE